MKLARFSMLVILASGCDGVSAVTSNCGSVAGIKSNPSACANRTIEVNAYLVSTRHGEYIADTKNGSSVISVTISESPKHRKTTEALLEKLGRASRGKAYAEIQGRFEGRLMTTRTGEALALEIYAEVR